MKILIVEDSRADLAILHEYVRRFGAQAVLVQNGHEAIACFAEQKPDLVLLDVVLPDIDGYTVARRLRELEPPGEWTPIIFLSAMGRDEDIEKGIAAGGDDYLSKPVSGIVLNAKIRAMQRLIQMQTSLLVLTRRLDSANRELQRLSSTDGLTGIANRRFFDDTLQREWRRARRNSGSVALLICDVDHFKGYNDHYGHVAGDDCLRRIAATIQKHMERASDLAARYGGEEFAVILPETSIGSAALVAERIRHAIAEQLIPHAGSSYGRITLSIGVAAAVPGLDNPPDDLVLDADRALYQAKSSGRDAVCRADTLPSKPA